MRLGLLIASLGAAEFQAGLARTNITPPLPFWLSGYAARTNAVREVLAELWANALALEDPAGRKVVMVTTDLIGLPREVTAAVAKLARQKHRLERSQVLFNSSHTHGGPVVWPNLAVMFTGNPEAARQGAQYSKDLTSRLTGLIDAALAGLEPAQLSTGHGTVGFAANRREPGTNGVRIGVNRQGPVDHDVPVLKIADAHGHVRAVLFGYACHNTTLGGDCYRLHGDYAGFAKRELEATVPDVTAMFMMLCGADQNPSPRGTVELATQYGQALGREVSRVLQSPLQPVRPSIATAYQEVSLAFTNHTRAVFEEESKSPDRYKRARAALMLEAYDRGQPVRELSYPVQAVRLGTNLTFVALGGEVVVDYALRLKREWAAENLVVSGYCNDVMCYIPSRRVLREGGYEPVISMIYYGQPGPFQENVEEVIVSTVGRLLGRVGAKGQ